MTRSSAVRQTLAALILTVGFAMPVLAQVQSDDVSQTVVQYSPTSQEELGLALIRAFYDSFPSLSLKGVGGQVQKNLGSSGTKKPDVGLFAPPSSGGGNSNMGGFAPSIVGEFDFGRADGSNAIQFFGGPRFTKDLNEKIKLYLEFLAGATHSPGETDFTMKFGGGVFIPIQGKPFFVFVGLDVPFIFFSGAHEHAIEINGGIGFHLR
jgi:hypothetical protein